MHDAIVAWLSLWSQALLRAAWEGGLAAGVAWSIETCWTSMPVAWRSWMWRLVFVKTALAFMPLSIALPVLPAHPTPSDNAPMAAMAQDMRPTEVTDSDHRLATSPTLTLVGCGAWLLGMGVCAYVLGRGTRDVRRRLSASQPIVDASLLRAMRCLSDQLQVAKPQLRGVTGGGSPCLIGGKRRPVLLIPTDWLSRSAPDQVRLALAHELAHVSRGDLGWNRLVALCQTLLFFQPLLWLATRRYLSAQELACDALALQHTQSSPAHLARLLLQLAERSATPWYGAVTMTGTHSQIRERITAMFRSPSRPPRFTAWGLACVGCISLLPMTLSAQSTSLLPEQPPQPSAFGYPQGRATASASATARSSANSLGYSNRFGSGMGTGGNPNRRPPAFGYGHGLVPPQARSFGQAWAHAQAQARATVGQIARPPAHQEEPPTRSLWDPRGNRTSESPPQSTAAKEGLGQAWARSTQSVVNGETVTIEESQGRLAVTVERADGTRETTVASDPRQLADRSPSAARHYRQLVPPSSKHSGDPLSGEPPSDARVLLRQQLEALQASPEIRGRPLESLLDDVIRELP